MRRHIRVRTSQTFLDFCAEKNCCGTLDMYNQEKSRGDVIEWKHRHWVCTGSTSQYLKYQNADLHECVPADKYHGPAYRYNFFDEYGHDPDLYYLGGRLRCKGQIWIMTDLKVTLVSDLWRRWRDDQRH